MKEMSDLFFLLRDRLQQGFTVDESFVPQVEAFFGLMTDEALEEVLTKDALFNSGLAELLFEPEQDLRTELEAYLPLAGLEPAAFENIRTRLEKEVPQVPLCLANGAVLFPSDISTLLHLFLNALHLTYEIPLTDKLDIPSTLGYRIRAVLRERAASLDPIDKAFVEQLVQGFCGAAFLDEALTLQALRYSLALIADREPGSEIFDRFALQKTNLQKELAALEDFRAMYGDRYSMDFLMMSGVKVPTLDEATAKDEIFLIDKICFTVFRRGPEGLVTIQHSRVGVDSGEAGSLGSVLNLLN